MRCIVVGGGMAGLRIAKKLRATLITDKEEFVFLPRLPDCLSRDESYATRSIPHSHPDVILGRVQSIDLEKKHVHLKGAHHTYDYLVLATGATCILPVSGAKEYAIPFYSLADVRKIKQSLPARRIVVVGGGPTGIEVASELSSFAKVVVLQGDSEILPLFPAKARKYALSELARQGVSVHTNELVERITKRTVVTKNDSFEYDICVWCAGVRTDIPSGVPVHKGILVDEFLRVKGQTHVFAAGDCAQSGAPLTAQAAVQEADIVVENIRRMEQQRSLKQSSYRHKGDMLSLGSNALVISPQGVMLTGKLGSVVRSAYYAWQLRDY